VHLFLPLSAIWALRARAQQILRSATPSIRG
jgi:hypothetical protein